MTFHLPAAVAAYFAAANGDDADAVAASFTAQAVVRDEGRDIEGRAAIGAWAMETRRKYRFHAQPLSAREDDAVVVTARVEGDFPGSPVELAYHFRLSDDLIDSLEIG